MKARILVFFAVFALAVVFTTLSARAACVSPAGDAGTLQYNYDARQMEYCNGNSWVSFPRSPLPTGWKQISAGIDWAIPFTCAIASDDSGWCWGSDANGRLGNGAAITGNQTTPTPIEGGYRWRQISAGYAHACGIRMDGVAMCWGGDGALGNGDVWGPDQPAPVVVSGGHSWSKISAGGASCGIRTDGVAMCWGFDASGRLGNGASGNADVPGVVTGGYTWADISVGGNHTCGVTTSSVGYCWGESENGKLGNGTTTPDAQNPSLVAGGHTWSKIFPSGYLTTCGMTTAGAAYCWGEAAYGKLGNGTTTPDQSSPSLVLGGHTFQDVQSGTNAGCGLRTDNQLYCWGDNGWESTGTGGSRTSPFVVSGGHSWASMSVGGTGGCGIRPDGEAMCWGRSDTGALGNGVTNPNTSAVPVLVRDAIQKCTLATFSAMNPPEVLIWQDIAYGNGIFVAVGESGTNRVMRSTDYGLTWTGHAATSAQEWEGVTYGNGLFVAVADTGTNAQQVMTSPDGITWTARTIPAAKNWGDVTYGNGRFVAVSSSSNPSVGVSTDGITWTLHNASEANTWEAVTYGGGQFVAVSRTGTNRVMTSPDGQTWTARAAAQANQWYNVAYGNNIYVAVSTDGTNRIMSSPDGITWTARTSPSGTATWQGLVFANGIFIATGTAGADRLMTSTDGINWTLGTVPAANDWFELAYGNGVVVSVAEDGTDQIMRSSCSGPGCVSPAGTAGSLIYNQIHRVAQWCDGSTWHAAGPIGPTGPNSGCSTPTGTGGDVRFNSTACVMQYCDGDNWRRVGAPNEGACAVPGQVMSDGSVYAGLSPDGNVPMFTTPADAPGGIPWNNGNNTGYVNLYTPITQSDIGGEASTAAFIGVDSDSVTGGVQPFQAPEYCAALNAHGHTDWYVPARDEFTVLHTNRVAIGGFGGTNYWTSTEVCCNAMIYANIDTDGAGSGVKHFANRVRCVRK